MSRSRTWRPVLTAVVGLVLVTSASPALADPAFCSDSVLLSKSDITFRQSRADDCYGVVNGSVPGRAGELSLWGGGWDVGLQDTGAAGTTGYLGLSWTLEAPQDLSTGKWSLRIAGPALPVTLNVAAVLKGASSSWAAYLFSAEQFTEADANRGNFVLRFTAGGTKVPDLANMDVFLRNTASQTVTTVPDGDGSVAAMLGLGLFMTAALCRRRLSAAR